MYKFAKWHPGKSLAAVWYAAIAYSDSSYAEKQWPNAIQLAAKFLSIWVALLKYFRA